MASLISKIVAEVDYSVKMISKRCTTRLLLFVFVKNHSFTFLTSELTFSYLEMKLSLQMTLKMTLNHKKKGINRFFDSKSHEKEVLHMLSALFVQK